jgi:flagellin
LTTLNAVTGTAATTFLEVNGDKVQSLSAATTLDEAVQKLDESVAGVKISSFVELEADIVIDGGNGALSGTDSLILTVKAANHSSASNVINIQNTTDLKDLVAQINEKGGETVQASINDEGRLVISSSSAENIAVTGAGDGLEKAGFSAGVTQQAQLKFEITDSNIEDLKVSNGTGSFDLATIGLNEVDGNKISGATTAVGTLAADILVINGVSIGAGTAGFPSDTAAAINRESELTGVIASAGTVAGAIELTSVNGKAIKIEAGAGDGTNSTATTREAAILATTGFQVTNEADSTSSTIASIDISTAEGAQRAIGILTEGIQQVSEVRGDLGAVSNRLDYTTRNLSNISENAASARSAIMDADFAAESANLSRAQVLQQAGNAMLAQANSRPQQVLSLLQ